MHTKCGSGKMLTVLLCFAAYIGSYLPTFRDNMPFPFAGVKQSYTACPMEIGPTSCPETSVSNYHSILRNIAEERSSHLHRGGSLKLRR